MGDHGRISAETGENALVTWCRQRPEPLLTAAALPLMLWLSGAGSGGWHLDLGALSLVIASWLPLLVRNRWPVPVLAAVSVLDALRAVALGHNEPASSTLPIATILACYTVGARCTPRIAWASATAGASVQFAIVTGHFDDTGPTFLYFNWALVGTAVGSLIAERRRRLAAAEQRAQDAERTKEEEARRRVVAERLRIARELHDSLAHHITVVNAQAGVAQYLLRERPDAAEAALSGIVGNTRAALDELRATLGLLRDELPNSTDDAERTPAPGLKDLPTLVAQMRSAGMTVDIDVSGEERPVSAVTDLAAYRIVQEALSNAARHAPGSVVSLGLHLTRADLRLTIANAEASHAPGTRLTNEGTGYGLIGMRERATAAGGRFDAGPTPGGGFLVDVVLPIEPRDAPDEPNVSGRVQ